VNQLQRPCSPNKNFSSRHPSFFFRLDFDHFHSSVVTVMVWNKAMDPQDFETQLLTSSHGRIINQSGGIYRNGAAYDNNKRLSLLPRCKVRTKTRAWYSKKDTALWRPLRQSGRTSQTKRGKLQRFPFDTSRTLRYKKTVMERQGEEFEPDDRTTVTTRASWEGLVGGHWIHVENNY
jgi:hypothetical protein